MATVTFKVDGDPIPQGSKRIGRNRATGRPILLDDNDVKLGAWRQQVSWVARGAHTGAPWLGPIQVRVTFAIRRPISVSEKRRPLPNVKPDIDKLLRAVLDACTGIVWVDDAQVVDVNAVKVYRDTAGCSVSIAPYEHLEAS